MKRNLQRATKCLVTQRHRPGERKGQVGSSSGLKLPQTKLVLESNTSFVGLEKKAVFYPFCFCWVPLTTVFLPPIVCPMCKNKTVPHLTKTLSDLRLYADKHTLILMIRSS